MQACKLPTLTAGLLLATHLARAVLEEDERLVELRCDGLAQRTIEDCTRWHRIAIRARKSGFAACGTVVEVHEDSREPIVGALAQTTAF